VAVRGGIVDLWPPGFEYPLRVELAGDAIASIRLFDPSDQRSFQPSEDLVVLPSAPVALARMAGADVRRAVAERCEELLLPSSERRRLDEYLTSGVHFPGVELLAPYAYGKRSSLADFLDPRALVVAVDPPAIESAIDALDISLGEAAAAASAAGSFFPDRELLYLPHTELRALTTRRPLVELDATEAIESGGEAGHRSWRVEVRANTGLAAARVRISAKKGESGLAPVREALDAARAEGCRVVMMASDSTQLGRIEHLLGLAGAENVRRGKSFTWAVGGERREPPPVLSKAAGKAEAKAKKLEAEKAAAQQSALFAEPAPPPEPPPLPPTDPKAIWLVEGHLREGFSMPADHLLVVSDEEVFGERRSRPRRRKAARSRMLSALAELKPDDYVVHVDHGVGRYHGLRHLKAGGTEGDFLHIEYAGGDRYYLPVDRINLVEKYSGAGGAEPALDKIGGTSWERAKRRARDSILEMARQLLDLEAYRAVHTRPAWAEPGTDFEEFEARFPFEETEGQLCAIADILSDLARERPMDRVVCGDVGYGKTEVAIRAAYLVAMAGRQVAFLVPTTVLARQHYETLRTRLEGYPLRLGVLSRFETKAENAALVKGLADGTLDVVVGTHRLLQADVRFARLGLVVIDEEHRFGVRAKEHMKALRREVDVLTMTATPIPRTLQLSLSGVRDLSVIETPPVDRLAIRTYVARYDEGLVRQAVQRELGRGGQVFFVHNRVSSIDATARRLGGLVGGARIAVAHGQMEEGALEKVMVDFLDHKIDVLVCTSIIESGLDIPNANTILIDRADTFGLAQLYQMRGRVGRSHRRAYAYLLVPGERITEDARKRLAVLQDLDDLGAGFRLAAHDLEIRGAGNLLGKAQSGHIAAVGFDLFLRMMEEATQEMRDGAVLAQVEPEIELGAEAFLPGWYVEDIGERLLLYKRLANAPDAEALAGLRDELRDRFGPLPHQAGNFVRIMALRPTLKRLLVVSLKASDNVVALRFDERSEVSREQLLRLATEQPRRYRVRPEGVLTMQVAAPDWNGLVDEIEKLLARLVAGPQGGRFDDDPSRRDAKARVRAGGATAFRRARG
ncbi:MAG: transcription-repair coupling factor, partial [Deltaproteobacteria bacterium]|nr:transcription-repair coupling factor [Deltaproteobacteria bacterium]